MPRRRLTQGQRLEIARERAKGARTQDLAARFEVSPQAINAVVRQLKAAPAVADAGTYVVSVRLSERELRAFEVTIGRFGLTRSEALKRLVRSASGTLALDEDASDRLKRLGAEVNRIGLNLNQVARACNEARQMGQRIPYTAKSHAVVRAAVELVADVVGQVQQMARSRRAQLDVVVAEALRNEGDGEPA